MHSFATILLFFLLFSVTAKWSQPSFIQKVMLAFGEYSHPHIFNLLNNKIYYTNYIPHDTRCNGTIQYTSNGYSAAVCQPNTVAIDPLLLYSSMPIHYCRWSLKTQTLLAQNVSFCQTQLLGTHNSAISSAYGFGIEDTVFSLLLYMLNTQFFKVHTLNQYLSITDQLNLGVRVIELDIHFVIDQLRIAHCGGFSSPFLDSLLTYLQYRHYTEPLQYDSESIGCHPSFSGIPSRDQINAESILKEIGIWLNEPLHHDEFLLLYFDIYKNLETWGYLETLELMILQYVPKDILILPSEMDPTVPLYHYIQHGKRVLLVSRYPYAYSYTDIFLYRDSSLTCNWTEPSLLSYVLSDDCSSRSFAQHRSFTRIGCNVIRYGPVNSRFIPGPSEDTITTMNINSLYQCGVNTVGIDLITPTIVSQTVWTWSHHLNLPFYKHTFHQYCTAFSLYSQRWVPQLCSRSYPLLCRHLHSPNAWTLSPPSIYPSSSTSCPSNYTFSVPNTLYENHFLVRQLQQMTISSNYIWLHYDFQQQYMSFASSL